MNSPLAVLSRRGLATRLLVTQAVVLVAGLATAWLVATLVGPPLFHRHLAQGTHSALVPELNHVEDAFASASVISLAVALATALLMALFVSIYLTRRIQKPLGALARAAEDVSQGLYVQVPASGIGAEFDQLATAFNHMAKRLDTVEDNRRRLLLDLAHELRTPVTLIEGYLEGLEDGVVRWDSDTAHVMREQTDRLIRLIEDINEVSQAEEGRLPLDLDEVSASDLSWTAAAAMREPYLRKGVNLLENTGSVGGVCLLADRQRIGQVLTNLLTNALRHTPAGGTVELEVTRDEHTVAFSVTDNGEGIAPEHLGAVFERFYRGDAARDREHGGSGIGLTISLALARSHGGNLTASSAGLGHGATFVLTLPMATADAQPLTTR